MYRRILVPLDASDLAESALPHASSIASASGAEVRLLQVVDPADLRAPILRATLERIGDLQEPDRSEALEGWKQSAREYLEHVAERLRAEGVASVAVSVQQGNPFELIPAEAAAAGCDLVIVASHGRSGLGRALLGSVTDHLLRGAHPFSVLVVRPPRD